jgi:hypothetical protein
VTVSLNADLWGVVLGFALQLQVRRVPDVSSQTGDPEAETDLWLMNARLYLADITA